MKRLIPVISLLIMVGCAIQQPTIVETTDTLNVFNDSASNKTIQTEVKEHVYESDKAHTINADSAYAALLLKCDSIGNVYIDQIVQEQGLRIALEMQLEKAKDGSKLQIKSIQDEFEVIIRGLNRDKETLIKENTELRETLSSKQFKEKQEPIVIKEVPGWVNWVKWLAIIGAAFILYYVIRIVLFIYRKFLGV